jgi:hypothetical protein
MGTDQDWRQRIDRSFGDGPEQPPIAGRLEAGRRALRRRRIAVGAATAVVAGVVGGAVWVAAPSETRVLDTPTADGPDGGTDQANVHRPNLDGGKADGAGDETDGVRDMGSYQIISGEIVTMGESGWKVMEGWTVTRREDNPMGYRPPRDSVAMAVANGPERLYVFAVYDGSESSMVPMPGFGSWESWLSEEIRLQRKADRTDGVDEVGSAPVHFGEGETLVAGPGVTILDQLPHPDLPRNFAGPNDRSAAAWIDDHGAKTYVLVRETYGEEQVVPWDRGDFDSLEAFVDFARQRYEAGVGLL